MDDTFFIIDSLDGANELLKEYYSIASTLDLRINKNKTKIIPFGKKFNYCKWKYLINEKDKIRIRPVNSTIYRQRKKLKKMINLGLCNEEIKLSKDSFIAYLNIGNSYKYTDYLNKIN